MGPVTFNRGAKRNSGVRIVYVAWQNAEIDIGPSPKRGNGRVITRNV